MGTFSWRVYLLHQNVVQNHHIFKQGKVPESRGSGLAREEKRFPSPQPLSKSKTREEGGTKEAAASDGLSSKGKYSYSLMEKGLHMLRGQRGGP